MLNFKYCTLKNLLRIIISFTPVGVLALIPYLLIDDTVYKTLVTTIAGAIGMACVHLLVPLLFEKFNI